MMHREAKTQIWTEDVRNKQDDRESRDSSPQGQMDADETRVSQVFTLKNTTHFLPVSSSSSSSS
jgi:hypothetical protein